jgi:glycosyltransferase involved in cell wall biosynthesis
MISEMYPPVEGGAEQAAQRYARAIHGLGFDVHVLTTEYHVGPAMRCTEVEPDGITVTRVRATTVVPYRTQMVEALRDCERPDVVIVFYLRSYAADAVRFASRWGVPVILCSRGSDAAVDLMEWEHAPFIMEAVKRATKVTAVTLEIGRILKSLRSDRTIDHWPNTVDLDRFRPVPLDRAGRERHGLPPDGLLIGFCGVPRPIKGLFEILDAFPLVAREVPNAWLVLIGRLREEAEEALAHWRELHPQAAERLKLVPYMPQEQLPPILSSLDIVWYPPVSDGFSNSLLQTVACGVPSIVTPVGANGDLVTHEETGLVVPVGDPAAMAAATLRMVADMDWARAMAARGRKAMEAAHHPDTERQRLMACFQALGLLSGG